MKCAVINASPKGKSSASGIFADILQNCMSENAQVIRLNFKKAALPEKSAADLKSAEALVFVFPLYMDGVPGHLLSCLAQMEEDGIKPTDKRVYAAMNCGFYEGEQCNIALDILKNWCIKAGLEWCGGIGVGGGGCIETIADIGIENGPMKPVHTALKALAADVLKGEACGVSYLSVGMPRFFYKFAAQLSWRKKIKDNGGNVKDLAKKPEGDLY